MVAIQVLPGEIVACSQVSIINFLLEFSILLPLLGTSRLASLILETLGHSGVRAQQRETRGWKSENRVLLLPLIV
jgi:hypothetical protein